MVERPPSTGNSMYDSFHGFFNGLFGAPDPLPGHGPPAGFGHAPSHGQRGSDRGGQPGGSSHPRSYMDSPGPRGYDEFPGRSPHQGDSRAGSQSWNRNQEFSRDRGHHEDFGGGPQKPWKGEAPSRELSLGQQSTGPPPSASSSGTHTPSRSTAKTGPYVAVKDDTDLLDQHVAYFFKHNPDAYRRHPLVRKREGVYELHGREINVEWQYNPDPQKQGFLVVNDWPLRQPFSDYMQQTEANAEYDHVGNSASLGSIPREQRLTFNDKGAGYSRLEAMKVAKEQALVRERAASYTQQGQAVPQQELIERYEKTMRAKLGQNRQSAGNSNRPRSPGREVSAPQLPAAAAQPGQGDQSRPRGDAPSASRYPAAVGGSPAGTAIGGWPAAHAPQDPSPLAAAPWPGPAGSQGLVQPNLFGAGGVSPAGAASPYGNPSGQRYGFFA